MVKRVVLRERCKPEFIIMYPALGCPGIATPQGGKTVLHVVLLVRNGSPIIQDPPTSPQSKQAIASRLSYSKWTSPPTNTYGKGTKVFPADVTDIEWHRGWNPDSDTLHKFEFSTPQRALDNLVSLGYDSYSNLLHLHLQVTGKNGFYNLVNRDLESEFVRKALSNLQDPAAALGHPAAVDVEDTKTLGYFKKLPKKDVELYHPFLVTDKEYLNVAHVADPHISTHWELYKRRLKNYFRGQPPMCEEYTVDSAGNQICVRWLVERFNNYNKRFWKTLREINSDSDVDIIVLGGDLIDYNLGHIIDVSENARQHDRQTHDDGGTINRANYRFNRNWVLFYDLLLNEYKKPIFTILGNHEYLLNPYPTTQIVHVRAWGWWPRVGGDTESFAHDMNLTYGPLDDPPGAEARQIAEIEERTADIATGRSLRPAIRDHNETELERLLRQEAPDLLGPPTGPPTGVWWSTPDAVSWYHLVINPFADFTFAHLDQSFLMLDWKGVDAQPNSEISQVGSLLLLPKPEDCLSPSQKDMVQRWLNRGAGLKILCTHAPLLDPWTDIGNYDLARGKFRRNIDDESITNATPTPPPPIPPAIEPPHELDLGTMRQRRWLLSELSGRVVVLSGHSHTNRMFQIKDGHAKIENRQVFLLREDDPSKWNVEAPFIIVTNSCGPIGRDNEVSQWQELVPPGYRVVKFNQKDAPPRVRKGRMMQAVQIRFTEKCPACKKVPCECTIKFKWLRDVVKYEVNTARYDQDEIVIVYDSCMHASPRVPRETVFDGYSGLIQKVDADYTVDVREDDILVIKEIEPNRSLTITNNDGAIAVLENRGDITFEDNDHFARVSSNRARARVTIRGNDATIQIETNHGRVHILGNDSTIRVRQCPGWVTVDGNDGTIEVPYAARRRVTRNAGDPVTYT